MSTHSVSFRVEDRVCQDCTGLDSEQCITCGGQGWIQQEVIYEHRNVELDEQQATDDEES